MNPIILELLTSCPVISTDQVAVYFAKNRSPLKRASEQLVSLEHQRVIEGRRREIGKTKVWRLSNKGRKHFEIKRHPVPLNSMKIDHYLAISSAWQKLRQHEKFVPSRWLVELRETMDGKERYCPDAFFVFKGKPYLLEVQLSKKSTTEWGLKWAKASAFFDSDHYKNASFQLWPGRIIRPDVVVISSQQPDTVKGNSRFPIQHFPSIEKFMLSV